MINRTALLSDLQSVLRKLEADLLERTASSEVPEVGEWLRAEYQKAKDAERTAHTFKQWLDDFITQVAAAWVLSCVFARFLEDNELVDPPRIAGPGKRLEQARDEHTLFFQDAERAKLTDREYLLDIFAGLAKLPTGKDVFGPHNPMNALPNWLGPDAAGELLRFFQKIDSDSGELVHDFTDPPQKDGTGWDTRFLGDLYQDLSEAARKKYALLQTPDFVEEFILDRTLEPALDEFGLTPDSNPEHLFKMIDPACGSGHFLLGTFPRILDRRQKQEPGTNIRELVQRTLDSIHGVDINPFAIAIARFRLLLAALKACDIKRLQDAPAFTMNLACGDSLYHGRQRQQMLGDWTDESHYFRTEDAENLRRILQEGTFHAVVANPPYIVPKDKAANEAYRRLYTSCHMKYALTVPFMERILRLAIRSGASDSAGFTGQITATSFMKRSFGKRLIEDYFKTVDLTHVIDTKGVVFGNAGFGGTSTAIIFGRNRESVSSVVRTVMALRGEPGIPAVASKGVVWTEIKSLVDQPGTDSEFLSIRDLAREKFQQHPWSLGGGPATKLLEHLDAFCKERLEDKVGEIGIVGMTNADDVMIAPELAFLRKCVEFDAYRRLGLGDELRDWRIDAGDHSLFPYEGESLIEISTIPNTYRWLWPARTTIGNRATFGRQTYFQEGRPWWEWHQVTLHRLREKSSIVFSFLATHNNFVLDRVGRIFKQSAPIIKPATADDDTFVRVLGILNSSVACFWMKQVFHSHGAGGGTRVAAGRSPLGDDNWESHYEFDSTKIKKLPICLGNEECIPVQLSELGEELAVTLSRDGSALEHLDESSRRYFDVLRDMIRLQEDLDWECYRLYGLLEDELTYPTEQSLGIQLGERAFEIVLARRMAAGEVTTTWFERHGSTPITEIPDHWPDDYKKLVQQRIEVIETNPQIALIEQPEYKRRWNTEPWDSQVERALRSWLLDRLESYFDFDGRMNDAPPHPSPLPRGGEGASGPPLADIQLVSVVRLADIARQDKQFMEVAEVYRDDPAFDVQRLVAELVQSEHVPLLPVLRYKPSGLRNRAEWEKTWELQRLEDKLRAGEPVKLDDYELTDKQREQIAKWQTDTPEAQRADDRGLDAILSIPVPPKYKSSDFISTGGARYWSLRGKLDVPKERWVSFPHCEGPDGTLMIAWAGYNHLQLAQAISAYYVDVQERLGGRDDPRLIPLLAGVIELLPWLKQWHHEIDPEYNQRMDEVYEGFVTEEAKGLNLTIEEIKAWEPPQKAGRKKKK